MSKKDGSPSKIEVSRLTEVKELNMEGVQTPYIKKSDRSINRRPRPRSSKNVLTSEGNDAALDDALKATVKSIKNEIEAE